MAAAVRGQAQCLAPLLAYEPLEQVRAVDKDGYTALMMAAADGRAQCLAPLLAHATEVQVWATAENGWTALEIACNAGFMQCARVLLAHKSPLPFDPELLVKLSPLIFKLAAQ